MQLMISNLPSVGLHLWFLLSVAQGTFQADQEKFIQAGTLPLSSKLVSSIVGLINFLTVFYFKFGFFSISSNIHFNKISQIKIEQRSL